MTEREPVIVLASEECQAAVADTMEGKRKPDFTVTKVSQAFHKWGLALSWETVSAGFGELSIFTDEQGRLAVDTEAMGKEFAVNVLVKWLEGASWE